MIIAGDDAVDFEDSPRIELKASPRAYRPIDREQKQLIKAKFQKGFQEALMRKQQQALPIISRNDIQFRQAPSEIEEETSQNLDESRDIISEIEERHVFQNCEGLSEQTSELESQSAHPPSSRSSIERSLKPILWQGGILRVYPGQEVKSNQRWMELSDQFVRYYKSKELAQLCLLKQFRARFVSIPYSAIHSVSLVEDDDLAYALPQHSFFQIVMQNNRTYKYSNSFKVRVRQPRRLGSAYYAPRQQNTIATEHSVNFETLDMQRAKGVPVANNYASLDHRLSTPQKQVHHPLTISATDEHSSLKSVSLADLSPSPFKSPPDKTQSSTRLIFGCKNPYEASTIISIVQSKISL